MAAIAPLPPTTPQQSFSHMPPQTSPQQHPSSYGNSYNMSFESQHSQGGPSYSQSFSNSQASFPNGPVSGVGYSRSFGESNYGAPRGYEEKPQIYTVRTFHVLLALHNFTDILRIGGIFWSLSIRNGDPRHSLHAAAIRRMAQRYPDS